MTIHMWPDDELVASKRIVESMGYRNLTFSDVGVHHGEAVNMLWASGETAQKLGNL
jgi:hypothetical protein